jgi:Tol biopolymer transport system component
MSRSALETARKNLLIGMVATAAVFSLDACQDAPSPLAPDATRAAKGSTGKPGTAEAVLFSGTKDGNEDIYSMSPDGSNIRRLTTDAGRDRDPDFAPGNRKMVFVHSAAGDGSHSELWTANADGSKAAQLTTLGSLASQPRYSPDGTKIAFAAIHDGSLKIYVVNADGTGLTLLTDFIGVSRSPAWSPDGTKIAFESDTSGVKSVYTMDTNGQNMKPLVTCFQQGCGEPSFSPDGSRVAVTDIGNGNVFVVIIAQQLSLGVGSSVVGKSSTRPTWTKDGTQVVFASNRGIENTFELYVGTPGDFSDTNVRRLTVFSPGQAQMPAYSR